MRIYFLLSIIKKSGDVLVIYVILFEDDDSRAGMRAKHMTEHLAFLENNDRSIQAAGPLIETQDGTPAGGLWLVESDNPQAVRELIEADPFWPTGLRKSVRVFQWTKVFADGQRNLPDHLLTRS
jgi:uncharacterized protein YciI